MDRQNEKRPALGRRNFFKAAGAGVSAAGLALAAGATMTEKNKLDRIASNTWPIRYIFKTRAPSGGGGAEASRSAELRHASGGSSASSWETVLTCPGNTRSGASSHKGSSTKRR